MEEEASAQARTTTVMEYVKSMKGTVEILSWCREQFVPPTSYRFMKRVLWWAFLSQMIGLAFPWFMALGIEGLYAHKATPALLAVTGIFMVDCLGALFEWRMGHFTELVLGENRRTVERRINELFFSKNLGLHLEEGGLLTQENMEKGWKLIQKYGKKYQIEKEHDTIIKYYLVNDLFGLGKIEPFLHDRDIIGFSCKGPDHHVRVKIGNNAYASNIKFNKEDLENFIYVNLIFYEMSFTSSTFFRINCLC